MRGFFEMADEAVRPCSFAKGEWVLKTPHNYIAGRFQKAVRVRMQPYQGNLRKRIFLKERSSWKKNSLVKATEKKEQKIKPENHAPRKRGVIVLAVSGEIFVKRFFQGSGFRIGGR